MTNAIAEEIAQQPRVVNTVRTFIDENTGREIRQLTNFEHGAHLGYFRMFRQLPDGRMLAWSKHEHGHGIVIDADSGDVELLAQSFWTLKLRERDGRAWFVRSKDQTNRKARREPAGRQLWQIDLPGGQPQFVCDIPDGLPGDIEDVTIDGRHLITSVREQDLTTCPIPTTKDVESINRYFARPRRGEMWVCDLQTGSFRRILETAGLCPLHLDTSPVDPTLIRYCQDMPDAHGQRVWTIRIDGTERRPIRPQEYGEMVTHEFWWADPRFIAYTYQDRRQDPTLKTHHWAEYGAGLTRLGIADLSGREVYLSDPLDSYHSHLYRSSDGTLVSGEGTDGNSFVCAAAFSWKTPRLEMKRLATIHTTYVPFRGQGVDCNFSADGRWLIYADKIHGDDKPHQLFAVRVDL